MRRRPKLQPRYPAPWTRWRFCLPVLSLAGLYLCLAYYALHLQLIDPKADRGAYFLRQEGEERAVRTIPVQVHRGMISDRRGEVLAVSIPSLTLGVHPAGLPAAELPRLAAALARDEGELGEYLHARSEREFVYLQRLMEPDVARGILDLQIPGVQARTEYQRFYPAAEVTAGVVGLTDIDGRGLEGIEFSHDKWLRATPGSKRVLQDRSGRIIRELGSVKVARPGGDLRLSLDLRVQYVAYRELKRAVHLTGARGGSVVVVDVPSGEILAMVNSPSHNPNDRRELQLAHQRNRAAVDLFEPGSTIKPFAVLAALESGLYTPDSLIDTHPGYLDLGVKILHDTRNYGALDLGGILGNSSQVGIARLVLGLRPDALPALLQRVGFGVAPGAGLPGESEGRLPRRSNWRNIDRVNLSFGYGMSTTALQLAQAYVVLAADGWKRPLRLLHLAADQAPAGKRVLNPGSARKLLQMLEEVVRDGGTGARAQVFGYRVAGKTGTIRRYDPGQGAYSDNEHQALFAGVAPVSAPQVAAVVVIDSPRGDVYSGGSVAAPVFSRVMDVVLRLLNVPPDNLPVAPPLASRVERS